MRIQASFVRRPPVLWPLVAVLWVLVLALVVGGVSLATSGIEARRQQAQLDDHSRRLDDRLASLRAAQLPQPSELETLAGKVRRLNALSGLKGWSTPQLLAWLEQHMPQGVYLVALHHTPRAGELSLVAEARNAKLLRQFLRDLEGERSFREVLLSRQATSIAGGASVVQFEISVRLDK